MTIPSATLRRWRDSCDGNITIMFGLLLLPVLVTVGIGVDVARSYTAKIRFESAFENAASALRSSPATDSSAVIERRLQSYLDLAYRSAAPGEHVTLRLTDPRQRIVTMAASASANTAVLQLIGMKRMSFNAAARIARLHPPGGDETESAVASTSDGNQSGARRDRGGLQPDLWLNPSVVSR